MKTFISPFRASFSKNILVGSSPSLLNGNSPEVKGNSPGTFSCNCHFSKSPHPSYFGNDILGISVCDKDLLCVCIDNSLSLTLNLKDFLYIFFVNHSNYQLVFCSLGLVLVIKFYILFLSV